MARKTKDMKFTNKVIDEITKLDIKKKMNPAKTGIGRAMQNKKIQKFENQKLKAIREVARGQQGVASKALNSIKDVSTALIASETAREMKTGNSYRSGLSAWTKNFNGNPDPETGESGTTQFGSTTELGG